MTKGMEVLSVNASDMIERALTVLRQGGVIVYPTETAYGLGGDWTKPSVHRRVRQIKGRGKKKPLSVIVSDLAMARKFVHFSRISAVLVRRYWPGPLSLVLPLTAYALRAYRGHARKFTRTDAEKLSTDDTTLSLRISSHPAAQRLVRGLEKPLIATSANLSGNATLYDARAIARAFAKRKYQPDLIIDAGRLSLVRPSTVIAVQGDKVEVLREGPITINPNDKFQMSSKWPMTKPQWPINV